MYVCGSLHTGSLCLFVHHKTAGSSISSSLAVVPGLRGNRGTRTLNRRAGYDLSLSSNIDAVRLVSSCYYFYQSSFFNVDQKSATRRLL